MVIRYSTEELYEIGRTIIIESDIEDWIANYSNYQPPSSTTNTPFKLQSNIVSDDKNVHGPTRFTDLCSHVVEQQREHLHGSTHDLHLQQQLPPKISKPIQIRVSDLIPPARPTSADSSVPTSLGFGSANQYSDRFHEPSYNELQQQQQLADSVAEFFRKAQLNFHAQTSGIDPTKVRRLSEVEAELIGQREVSY